MSRVSSSLRTLSVSRLIRPEWCVSLAFVLPLPAFAAADLGSTDAASSSAIADCYRLAGEPYAPPAFKGVAIEAIEPDKAIAACEAAHVQDPKDAMLLDLTGRAYQAKGDFENARRSFELADKAGNAYARANLGWFLIEGAGGPADAKRGVTLLREGAEAGNVLAEYSLGLVFRDGRGGLKPDPKQAVQWLEKAAGQGHALAMYDLAILLRDGPDAIADPKASFDWLKKAATLGDADSEAALGYAYEQGAGVDADFQAAREWYRKAADQGQIDAMTNLGRLYEAGEGGARDYDQAFALYSTAANAGHAIAMANLANFYEFGLGTRVSPHEAAYWIARSIMAGNGDILDQVTGTPDDFAPAVRSELQALLKARGLYSGPLDGTMNAATIAALGKLPGQEP